MPLLYQETQTIQVGEKKPNNNNKKTPPPAVLTEKTDSEHMPQQMPSQGGEAKMKCLDVQKRYLRSFNYVIFLHPVENILTM